MHDSWEEVKISKLATVLLEWCLGGVQDFSGGGAAGAEVTARTAEVEPEDVTGLLQPCPSFTSWELLSTDEQRQWFKMESTPGEEAVKTVFRDIDAQGCIVKTVVLNAANLGFGTDPAAGMDPLTVDIADFQEVFETNLVWNFMIVRQAALRMKDNGGGAIVFISSNTAYRAIPNRTAYCASKGGINALSKALAIDLGPYGIRCNAVLPGTIKTARWVQMGSKQIVNGELTPIGDISDFEDIANAAWYLGTDLSKNVTGTELTVDGGMSCQLYPQVLNTLKRRYQQEQE